MFESKQRRAGILFSAFMPVGLSVLFCSCNSATDQLSKQEDSPPSSQSALDAVSGFAKKVLGERLREHYTEHRRGDLGVDALFESEELIGYTTYANEKYEKVRGPVDLEDCILFAGKFRNEASAESVFDQLKASAETPTSEVEGMVGIVPVQVRFLDKIRSDGDGGLFAQQGSYIFFLVENGELPPTAANWKDYEYLFLASLANVDGARRAFRLRDEAADR